ncbi:MAG: D-alanyl-D-alanine carboxypeptidase family protein [Clostridia bacterium]
MKIKKLIVTLFTLILFFSFLPVYADSEEPQITADAAILIDSNTGKILYSKNENEKMYPASTTKIMTAILTIENCNLDDTVTVPYEAIASIPSGYSVAALQPGEKLTVNQLLQVLMVHSANDAANVLAYHVAGSIESFATMMNTKVSELGLENTHFTNPSGKHDENHYTTAYDLSKIMQYCMKNSTFRTLAGLKSCIIPATNKYDERIFSSTNELLTASNYYYKYAIAGKTGYTTEAKNCLVSVANKDDLELISVVLGVGLYPNNLSGKFIETVNLFNYGYDNYTIRKLREKDAIATQIEVGNGTKETRNLDLLISDNITALVKQSDLETEFTPKIELDDNIQAPIAQGKTIGKIIYEIDGITYTSDLKASHNVEKSSFMTLLIQIIMIILILYLLYKLLFDNNNSRKKYNKKRKKIYKF